MPIPKKPIWLTVERARELFKYDPFTGEMELRKPNHLGRTQGSTKNMVGSREESYQSFQVSGTRLTAHAVAYFIMTGIWCQVDHKDKDGLNNAFINLRKADDSQNKMNGRLYINSKSGIRGVSPYGNKWRATIGVYGKKIYLGDFYVIEDAAKAYREARVKYFGEFG